MRVTGNALKRGKPGKWLTIEQNGYRIETNDYKCRLLYGSFAIRVDTAFFGRF